MAITVQQKRRILQVLNVFETGKPEGVYNNISIYKDGPVVNGAQVYQITYGRSQTTEFGNLPRLITQYIADDGLFATDFKRYTARLGKQPSLRDDMAFRALLKRAAIEDPKMRSAQDVFFDIYYYQPAVQWFTSNGFTDALSLLVIYDSQIHSGGIPAFLRKRFAERVPVNGGDGRKWISEYVRVRHEWLKTHTNPILQKTIYRTQCLKNQIAAGNWDLAKPINANGTVIR